MSGGVRPDESLAPLGALDDEAGLLEDGDVLLHGRERHVVFTGERRDRVLARDRPTEDVAPRGRGERVEHAVDLVIAELISYNHLVVG